jgi:pimeloyl-ACP methyl ester carboxylesterase
MGSFDFEGERVTYAVDGEGERVLVLVHGLLMNRRMFERLAPEMASRGNRVISVDLLGHGASDRPGELRYYSMSAFADQVAALLDDLGVEQAVVGGTSLGANVALEFAARHPERGRALFLEMPVLENALLAVAVIFTPIMVALQLGAPVLKLLAGAARRVRRTHYLLDILLDWIRRDPEASADVLQGLLLGRTAPTPEERRELVHPTLVIGHPADPLHPFSDAGMLVEEMRNARLVDANSILEWRLTPGRLNDELAAFLDEVWEEEPAGQAERAASAARGKARAETEGRRAARG